MSNELVTKPNGAVGNVANDTGIMLSEEDMIYPQLTLVQPTSRKGEQGKWYLSVTGESFESLRVVFFKNTKGRVMFHPDTTKMQAICGSDDRVVPSDRYAEPKASRCVECKFHRRGFTEPYPSSTIQVYQCDETVPVVGYMVDIGLPFQWSARRTSLKPLLGFLSMINFEVSRTGNKLCNYVAVMTTEKKDMPNKHYVPVIQWQKPAINDEYLNAMFNKVKAQEVRDIHGPEMDSEEVL